MGCRKRKKHENTTSIWSDTRRRMVARWATTRFCIDPEPEITLWNPASEGKGFPVTSSSGPCYSIAWSWDGRSLVSGHVDGTIHLWDSKTGKTIKILEGHTASVTSVSFSFDGLILASKSRDHTVRLWRTNTWEPLAILEESHSTSVTSGLAFHHSLPILATLGDEDTIIRIWE